MTTPGGGEELAFTGTFHDDISIPARAAADSIDELGDEATETAVELKALQKEADRTGNKLAFLAAKNKVANDENRHGIDIIKSIKDEYNRFTRVQDNHSKSTENLTKKKRTLTKVFRESRKAGMGFLGFLGKLFSMSMLAAKGVGILSVAIGVVGLVAAVVHAIPAILGLVQQLSTLLSLTALLPTAIGSLVASVATLKMAFKGIGDALGAGFSDDFQAYTDALNKLSPAAASFVRKVVGFSPQLKSLQKTVQESFFEPLLDDIVPTLETLIPIIGDGAKTLARSFGLVFGEIMRWARSPQGVSMILSFFRTAQAFADTFREHITPVLNGFSRAIETVEPIWSRLMNNMGIGMDKFGNWLTRISDDGTLSKWLDEAFVTAGLLAELFGSLLHIINALAGASDGGALMSLVLFFNTIADFLNSPEGQAGLGQFFMAVQEIVVALTPSLPPLLDILVLLAQIIGDIVVGAAPGFVEFLKQLAISIDQISGGDPQFWVKFGEAIGRVMTDLATWLPTIADVIGKIVGWLSEGDNLETALIIGAIIWGIVSALTFIIPAVTAVAGLAAAIGVPLGIVVAFLIAIVAMIAEIILGIYFIYKYWDDFMQYLKDNGLYEYIVQPFVDAYTWIDRAIEKLKEFTDKINLFGGNEGGGFSLWDAISVLSPVAGIIGRATGGPVAGGQTYLTNELGPEKFLSSAGAVSDIGDGRMGKWMAPSSGVVIPAGLTSLLENGLAAASNGDAYRSDQSTFHEDALEALVRGAGGTNDSRTYAPNYNIEAKGMDAREIERIIKKTWRDLKREEVQRA